jgi:hypothetical protein
MSGKSHPFLIAPALPTPFLVSCLTSVQRFLRAFIFFCLPDFTLLRSVSPAIFPLMRLADVEQIALKLSNADRALLAPTLLKSVSPDCLNHTDDEVERRERDMDERRVSEISFEELTQRVNAERRCRVFDSR